MADPIPHDPPGQPVFGGYLEADPDAPPRLTPVPSGGGRRRPRTPKGAPQPKTWTADLDSWDLTDPSYDADAWYIASRGNDKQSASLHLRVPEYVAEAMAQIVAARVFPIVKTREDFIRSAIVHELYRRIGEIRDQNFRIEVSPHTDLAAINAIRAENEAKRAFVLYCKEELEAVDGNPSMVRRIVEQIHAAMDSGNYDGALFRQLEDLAAKYSVKPKVVE
jgi:hypothetical protein